MIVDEDGYRLNVGIILLNKDDTIFWGRRIGSDAWQFPQGGLNKGESAEEALYRELTEEVGLVADDVEIISSTRKWIRYDLPDQYLRRNSAPLVIGQRQKWFLLRLMSGEQNIHLDASGTPEFDDWRWVDYWHPLKEVIYFKKEVYRLVLEEFEPILFPQRN